LPCWKADEGDRRALHGDDGGVAAAAQGELHRAQVLVVGARGLESDLELGGAAGAGGLVERRERVGDDGVQGPRSAPRQLEAGRLPGFAPGELAAEGPQALA
jgi:hypothetical protein